MKRGTVRWEHKTKSKKLKSKKRGKVRWDHNLNLITGTGRRSGPNDNFFCIRVTFTNTHQA